MDPFSDQPPEDIQNTLEEDPAAEFLAREQDELAALGDDDLVSGQVPGDSGDFDPYADQQQQFQNGELLDDFGGPPANDTGVTGEDFFSSDPTQDMFGYGDDASQQNGPTDSYASISQVDEMRAEPEKIRIWREEQRERLEKKDAEEEKKNEEWSAAAKKELDDWYKHQTEQLEKTKVTNRTAEEEFVKDRDESSPGQDWERIARLCEFNPKNSKNTKDVQRMRSILLQLKQQPLIR